MYRMVQLYHVSAWSLWWGQPNIALPSGSRVGADITKCAPVWVLAQSVSIGVDSWSGKCAPVLVDFLCLLYCRGELVARLHSIVSLGLVVMHTAVAAATVSAVIFPR